MISWKWLLFLTGICLVIQAFFAMVEMACVSFNKVRLEYYVNRGNRRAIWLSRLISKPTFLFGASMLGVNTAMLFGSECARRFYSALNLSPDWAALSQTLLVVIIAEIAPMFAGRRFAEHAAMLGMPFFYGFSIIVRPVIWFFHGLCVVVNKFVKAPHGVELFLSREELQKAIEEREEGMAIAGEPKEFDNAVANIFSLKHKTALELMQPLPTVSVVSSACTVKEMRTLLASQPLAFLPIYVHRPNNILAIAYPRDLLRADEAMLIRDLAKSPWFIVQTTSILEILKQFRRNNQIVAVVLDQGGQAVGILTLDKIVDEIFGQKDAWLSMDSAPEIPSQIVIDRSFSGDTLLSELKTLYDIDIQHGDAQTLEELCKQLLGHAPARGDTLRIDDYELVIEEAPLIGELSIIVRTIS